MENFFVTQMHIVQCMGLLAKMLSVKLIQFVLCIRKDLSVVGIHMIHVVKMVSA